LEEVILTLDELESLRLADLDGLYQEQAAEQMRISRPTFARIVEEARRKVADALVHGKALRLEGGTVVMKEYRTTSKHARLAGSHGTGKWEASFPIPRCRRGAAMVPNKLRRKRPT